MKKFYFIYSLEYKVSGIKYIFIKLFINLKLHKLYYLQKNK